MIAVFIVSFANTTLDSAARIQRFHSGNIQDSRWRYRRPVNNRYIATAIVVVAAAIMTFLKPGGQGAMMLWPLVWVSKPIAGCIVSGYRYVIHED